MEWECRGLLDPREAHEVLDMVLNRLVADGCLADPASSGGGPVSAAMPPGWPWPHLPDQCPDGPHRRPEGPNEDVDQCLQCGSLSWCLRPEGETYGEHLPDCSLPLRHESHCRPGGAGHPAATKIRGYWPGATDTDEEAR